MLTMLSWLFLAGAGSSEAWGSWSAAARRGAFWLIVLGLFSQIGDRDRGPFRMLTVLGSVPLFFYVTHLWLYSAIGALEPGTSSFLTMYVLWIVGLVSVIRGAVAAGRDEFFRYPMTFRFLS